MLPLNLLSTSFIRQKQGVIGSLWCLCHVAFAKNLCFRVLALFAGHHRLSRSLASFWWTNETVVASFQLEGYVHVWLISHGIQQDDRLITDCSTLADKRLDFLCMLQLKLLWKLCWTIMVRSGYFRPCKPILCQHSGSGQPKLDPTRPCLSLQWQD